MPESTRGSARRRGLKAALLAVAITAAGLTQVAADETHPARGASRPATRDILAVSNNWDGTIDLVDPHTFKPLKRINIIPDIDERMAEITADPVRLAYFIAIRNQIGEGHDQFVDDAFTSPDGRLIYVSRPSLADVVAISLKTGEIVWRTPVDGQRADHMAISPDGSTLLVSASTARVVDVIDTASGEIVNHIESGDSPHENNYSKDGTLIYHASIGLVYTPADDPALSTSKGDRWFEIVDAKTYEVLKRIDMGQALADAGYPDMSSAVRPMTLSPNERYVYFQVSFFHGFVQYDLKRDKVVRVANLPISQEAQGLRRDQYVLDSAHHGIAMNPTGTKICVAGTMSNYAAIVSRRTLRYRIIPVGDRPYWATNSGDGKYCFVSVAGEDRVAVISYEKAKQVASIPVGDHPQRMRMGVIRPAFLR